MARSKSPAGQPESKSSPTPTPNQWARVTWDDLETWAGNAAVARGRAYQKSDQVRDLKLTEDGDLLATVAGTHRYATTVALSSTGKDRKLESECTCPVGFACKHAVAVVAEYIHALVNDRPVPTADDDDPRWSKLESVGDVGGLDEDWDENEADEELSARTARNSARSASWDAKIEADLRAKSRRELADLAWTLVRRFPAVYEELRERIKLQGGDVADLVAETRAEISAATAKPGWSRHYSDEGYIPDFSRVASRFERLFELDQADELVSLGREFIAAGFQQAEESDDEGETLQAFAECLPVLFSALLRSSLSGSDRLLFAIDADLADDWNTIGSALDTIIKATTKPEDWSAVADALTQRLTPAPSAKTGAEAGVTRSHARDRLTDWIALALENAGRDDELQPLYEAEARVTGSYERLVTYLIAEERFDAAERWARAGIAATVVTYPGIATHLAAGLAEFAAKREQWDVVAAHAAWLFFDRPSSATFDDLIKAATTAGGEEPVREAAAHFLETGVGPIRLVNPPPPPVEPTRPKSSIKKLGTRSGPPVPAPPPAPPEAGRLEVDPTWPLPIPDAFLPLFRNAVQPQDGPRPRLSVLLDRAIAAGQPAEVLRWYDKMLAEPVRPGWYHYNPVSSYTDRVAAAVATAFPERTIEIYLAGLNSKLPHADQTAYQAAADYLKKLQPVYEALGRRGEWDALVASIREKYRNRPRFMEQLDRLDPRPIVASIRPKRK